MNGEFFGRFEDSERQMLKGEFNKFIKHSSYVVGELKKPGEEVKTKGKEYVIRMIDFTYSVGILSEEGRELAYGGDLDYEEIVFMILKVFHENESIFSEITESPRVSRAVARKNYEELKSFLEKNTLSQKIPDTRLITDQRSVEEKILNPTLDALSLLTSESYYSDSTEQDILLDYIDLLLQLGIIDSDRFDYIVYQSNDFDNEIYQLMKHDIFGTIIPKSSYLYDCFIEYENLYSRRIIYFFRKMISDSTLSHLEESVVNPKLCELLIEVFNEKTAEIFDRDVLIFLLEEGGYIGEKEKGFFSTITNYNDFAYYVSTIVFRKIFPNSYFTQEQEDAFYIAFEGFKTGSGQVYFQERNNNISTILDFAGELVKELLQSNGEELHTNFLKDFMILLEEYFPYKPFYLHILHAEFDEIQEIPSPFHKAIQILGILVCDILDPSHPLFEDASELLLCNTSSETNHASILRRIEEKNNKRKFPRAKSLNQDNIVSDSESLLELQDQQLLFWVKEIVSILESGNLSEDGEYVSTFFAFLLENDLFSQDEIMKFLETGDDRQNIFAILEQIFIRNLLGDFGEEETEYFEIFTTILTNYGENQRVENLIKLRKNR